MKALANITSSAIIAFALAVAVAPLAWGSTGFVASEVAVLFAHSDAVSATTDGSWGYFVGHNPGDFANVMDLTEGDAVMVCDRDSAFRTYYVVDTFTVTTEAYWDDIKDRVTGYGESIGLQCCVGDGAHYRVVVAC